jgi:hypothetical protein
MSSTPMTNSETQAIRDDLAFLRGLVERSDGFLKVLGRTYFAGGACYLAQVLLGLGQTQGWITTTNGVVNLTIAIGPTVIFAISLVVLLRGSRQKVGTPSQVDRAIGAFFGAIGLSNLVLIAVIGSVALREKSLTIWLIYPCAVFIFQGAAWLTMFSLRRRAWIGLVAATWFACALGMGLGIGSFTAFAIFAGLGLLFGMTLPGAWLMTRRSV